MDDTGEHARRPTRPLSENDAFPREEGMWDSRWGMTAHVVTPLVRDRCRCVRTFLDGNSVLDVD